MVKSIVFIIMLSTLVYSCEGIKDFFSPNPGAVNLEELNLDNIDSDIYKGLYRVGPVKTKVNVTVFNHKITGIDIIKHPTGQGQAAENIIKDVIKKQSVQVDVITGATISSKCILKAIETALEEKENK